VLIALKVIVTAAMLIVGCMLLLDQQINIGQFVAAEIVIIIVINSVEKLIVNLDSVYSTLTSVEKINKLLDKPAEKDGSYTIERGGAFSVDFRNVSFSYQEDRPILTNVSFSVKPGEKIAVTGKDGSGKSTILKLLTGAYVDFNGSLLVNEVPLGNYNLEYLRSNTGIVLSQQDVFAGTLWENITLGNNNIDKAYISKLVNAISLSTYISNLKEGYDTVLDPTGNRLPKNVVQKILLARALAHKPKLLLLEEPWLGIDEAAKLKIQDLLVNDVDATVIVATNDTHFIGQANQTIAI
jgi:ABC-type bacteriocin/lantibiotic exporter with double-glycine peptidase domain